MTRNEEHFEARSNCYLACAFWGVWLAAGVFLLVLKAQTRREIGPGRLTAPREVGKAARRPARTPAPSAAPDGWVAGGASPEIPALAAHTRWLAIAAVRRGIMMSDEALGPFSRVIASLGLPPDRTLRLKELIVEREESAADVEDLVKARNAGPGVAEAARRASDSAFGQALQEVVGPENIETIWQMMRLRPQLAEVEAAVGPDSQSPGLALTAAQTLGLAEIYEAVYAREGTALWPPEDRMAGYDAQTGLTAQTREVVKRAGEVLTALQLEAFKGRIALTPARGS